MSSWDEAVFADENSVEFLAECDELDGADLVRALEDACTVALNHAEPGDADHMTGLCAATVASIWCGAPFTAAEVADDHPLVRSWIGECPDELREVALQLLDRHLETLGDGAPDGLETSVEALG